MGGVREREALVRSKIALRGAVEKMMCLSGKKKKNRKWRFAEPRRGKVTCLILGNFGDMRTCLHSKHAIRSRSTVNRAFALKLNVMG